MTLFVVLSCAKTAVGLTISANDNLRAEGALTGESNGCEKARAKSGASLSFHHCDSLVELLVSLLDRLIEGCRGYSSAIFQ